MTRDSANHGRAASRARLDELERRLTGARRVGLFGHRNVGKTTLLAMFYRQASAGLIPDLRLAAPDPATAEYLADKIARIEAGESPAGTLAETELKLRLYHGPARYDLVLKDYQGEHVTLGSNEPILGFFADCDAALLCLDPMGSTDPAERRRRQQEVERLLESYIDQSNHLKIERPIAIIVTKYDEIVRREGDVGVEAVMASRFGMTLHAARHHAPDAAMFAVSAYGGSGDEPGTPPPELRPTGLDGPLLWVAERLEAADREQLEWIWDLAPADYPRLKRCVDAFGKRYPQSERLAEYRRELAVLRRRRLARRAAWAAGIAVAAAGTVAAYDYLDYRRVARAEADAGPADAARAWAAFNRRHPTIDATFPSLARDARAREADWFVKAEARRVETADDADAPKPPDPADAARLAALREASPRLAEEIGRIEAARNRRRHDERWRAIRAEANIPGGDPETQLEQLRTFLREFPETQHLDEAVKLAEELRAKTEEVESRRQRALVQAIARAGEAPDADMTDLVERCRRFLDAHPESPYRSDVETLMATFSMSLDDREFARAREFSRRYPANFAARIEKYDEYLRNRRTGGRHVTEALRARADAAREWDLHAYRLAYEHAATRPEDPAETARRLRDYVRDHPEGRFVQPAREYLDWFGKISEPAEYRVLVRRGRVETNVAKPLAGGAPDLSVTVEVAGVVHGPTPVIPDSFEPIWDYTFPKPVVWRLGDPVKITITDHDWKDSPVFTLNSPKGDPLAMRLLSNTIRPAGGGRTLLVFESDFRIPELPNPDAPPPDSLSGLPPLPGESN